MISEEAFETNWAYDDGLEAMDFLRDLLFKLRYYDWYWSLPEWLREPPGLYIAATALALAPLAALLLFIRGRWQKRPHREARGDLGREARESLKRGDFHQAGQRYETLGKHRAALAAYRRGGCHAEFVDLLVRRGKTKRAKAAAREAELWRPYAELCEADGELSEAAAAFAKAGQDYTAAGCYERAGMHQEAAHFFLKAGMDTKAAELLMASEGGETIEGLERAVRSALDRSAVKGEALEPQIVTAVNRCCQLCLKRGEAKRAYRLAADSELWEVAVPIARDHLPPSLEIAEACSKARAHLVAAEIYRQLGEERREALERGEHYQRQEEPAEAAPWFEKAEEWVMAAENWAAVGDNRRAAELYARAGNHQLSARLYGEVGDLERQHEMLSRVDATRTELEPTAVLTPRLPTDAAASLPSAGERYLLREELGRGGMGVVYRADDQLLNRQVAYKVLTSQLADSVEADHLLSEARAAAQLSHPNIVQVYDAGLDPEGAFFIVMELVEGETFATLLKQRKLSLKGVAHLGRQICAALAHAHDRHIIHRDLKPSNLIWAADKRVKLTDFGLARAFEGSVGQVFTHPAGTPFYMAPEQIRGEGISPRTDLYALGCLLFELATSRGPFGGDSTIHHHLNSQPDDPRLVRGDVPERLAAIILQCLQKDPGKRPQSAKEVARALAEAQG